MPLYLRVEEGTTDSIWYELNPLALILLARGWQIEIIVMPRWEES